jgi:hypothetical protein
METLTAPLSLVVRRQGIDPDDKIVAYACGACGTVHKDEKAAAACCVPSRCQTCGTEAKRFYYTECDACSSKRAIAREQARFEKATKVSEKDYYGPIVCEDFSSGDLGDYCWSDVSTLVEHVDEEQAEYDALTEDEKAKKERPEMPEYVYACEEITFRLSASHIIEGELENHCEDATDKISNQDELALQKFLDEWCAGLGIVSYQQDESKVVILEK